MEVGKSSITEEHERGIMRQINSQLDEAQRIAGKVQELLAEMQSIKKVYERCASEFQYGQFVNCIVDTSMYSERLTEKLRRLVLENFESRGKRQYCNELSKLHQIRMDFKDDIFMAELPCLLPHRKNKYTDYIYWLFYTTLREWCLKQEEAGRKVPEYEKATLCFLHLYDEAQPKVRIRDHDNIEEKQVVDALGTFFLVSDSGQYLNTYHATFTGNRDRTLIFLMDQKVFPAWVHESEWVSKNQAGNISPDSIG